MKIRKAGTDMKKKGMRIGAFALGCSLMAAAVCGSIAAFGSNISGNGAAGAANAVDNSAANAAADGRAENEPEAGAIKNISFGTPSNSNYAMKVAENTNFELMANEDGTIAVLDKRSGYLYESNPRGEDALAIGINKTNLASQLYVTWADTSGNVTTKNSQTDCVNKNWLAYSATADGGIRFTYEFRAVNITIPVEYRLTEKGLKAGVILEDIAEDSDTTGYYLTSFSLLPFFGAAGVEDSGYLFVPDGSGALIYLNNEKASYGAYSQMVYGRDAALVTEKLSAEAESARLPVFGLKNGDQGFLGIITNGDTNATINAMTSGTLNSYNNVYVTFQYRPFTRTTFLQGNTYASNGQNGDTSISLTISPVVPRLKEYTVEYNLMAKEGLSYVDMAKVYRDYLIENYGFAAQEESGAAFYLNLLGGLKVEDYVLGIKTNTLKPLTTFAQAQQILEQFVAFGVDKIVVKYAGWQKGGMESKIPAKIAFEKKLGGSSGYSKLARYIDGEEGLELYMDFDFVNLYQYGNGISTFSDAAQTVGSTPAYQYTYDYNLLTKKDSSRWKLLAPTRLQRAVGGMLKEKAKLAGANLALSTLGNMIYSDFTHKSDGIDRADAKAIWEAIFQECAENFASIMVENGNAYTFPYASHIYDVPLNSSGYDIEDEDVPFYQIVLHGYRSYSTEPVNLSAVPEELVLKAVETGSSLSACLMYAENTAFIDTKYDFIFSGNYETWLEALAGYYARTSEFLNRVAGAEITGHKKLQEDVYRTEFSNGVAVYVNYLDTEVTVDGIRIPAKDFVEGSVK